MHTNTWPSSLVGRYDSLKDKNKEIKDAFLVGAGPNDAYLWHSKEYPFRLCPFGLNQIKLYFLATSANEKRDLCSSNGCMSLLC